jgi:hypothetical protein
MLDTWTLAVFELLEDEPLREHVDATRRGILGGLLADPAEVRDLAPDDWLVVVRDPHDVVRAHHVLEQHPLVFLDDEERSQHRHPPPCGERAGADRAIPGCH